MQAQQGSGKSFEILWFAERRRRPDVTVGIFAEQKMILAPQMLLPGPAVYVF